MEWLKKMFAVTAVLSMMTFGVGLVAGCEDSDDPADVIGEAADDTQDAAEDAGDSLQDAADDAGDVIEDATN
ncbi:MAG: hypothetical protein AAGG38_11270 [Planctomycetota bacterium]